MIFPGSPLEIPLLFQLTPGIFTRYFSNNPGNSKSSTPPLAWSFCGIAHYNIFNYISIYLSIYTYMYMLLAFWLSSAPGVLSTLVTSVVLYSLTRATLMNPGQIETRVCGYMYMLYILYMLYYVCCLII